MGELIVLEGPNCVGKTPLANYLVREKGYELFESYFLPPEISPDAPLEQMEWEDALWGWAQQMTLAHLWKYKHLKLVADRGLLTWCHYYSSGIRDCEYRLLPWFFLLRKWEHSKIVLLHASISTLKKNALKKGDQVSKEELSSFLKLYSLVPRNLAIDFYIDNFEENWLERIGEKIVSSHS